MRKSFTLLELLVVIVILGLVFIVGAPYYMDSLVKSRNQKRKDDMAELKTALALYYADHGSYPKTFEVDAGGNVTKLAPGCFSDSYCGSCPYGGSKPDTGTNGYIPGLAPDYITVLPHDPQESLAAESDCYLYKSDGKNYIVLMHGTPEGTLSDSDPYYDPCRPTWAWKLSSSLGARGQKGVLCTWWWDKGW